MNRTERGTMTMTFNGAIIAFCLQYAITCMPDDIAKAVIEHLGAPYDQITWCCGTWIGHEVPRHWELEKPHTMLCDETVIGTDPAWVDGGVGSIYMGHERDPEYKNYCAIWLHKGVVPVS